MTPTIRILKEKKLIGKKIRMSLSQNMTGELWRVFMPRRNEIQNKVGSDLYSVQVYDPTHDFENFNPDAYFEKWAAVEVSDFNDVPAGMESLTLFGGLYAVFLHKGAAATGAKTFQYIFGTWLPNSDYRIDRRPHFELLDNRYKNDAPDSEEEVWIPIKTKK